MSIEHHRDINMFVPTCDYCGEELDAHTFFDDAVAERKAAGWHSSKDAAGMWWDMCPRCQRIAREKATRRTAQQDFEGVI